MKIGLCTERGMVKSSIVLAGDPQQLDAVVQSKYAVDLGLKTSFMENLFKKPCYMPDSTRGIRDGSYITQLTKNYRNHPKILQTSNKLFYSGILEPKASKGRRKESVFLQSVFHYL